MKLCEEMKLPKEGTQQEKKSKSMTGPWELLHLKGQEERREWCVIMCVCVFVCTLNTM